MKNKSPNPSVDARIVCAYSKCRRGHVNREGKPIPPFSRKRFDPVREHQKYCSDACRYNDFIDRKKAQEGRRPGLAARIRKIEEKLGI